MSGFLCRFGRDGIPLPDGLLHAALDGLARLGCDAPRSWQEPEENCALVLGHRSTTITAEDRLQLQPAVSEHRDLAIVADVRLDNRDELAGELGIGARELSLRGDCTLIMDAYRRWGEACVDRLFGDFAFVLWDRSRRELFCARDHIGYRPFFYHLSSNLFVAASSPRAVLVLAGIPRRLSEYKLSAFMVGLGEAGDSFYDGVSRLPAATWMRVDTARTSSGRYWTLDPGRRLRLASDGEYLEAFDEQLSRAVSARLRSAGEVGVFVSGGLDSSTVATFAAGQLAAGGKRLKGYTTVPSPGFSGAERAGCYNDESPLVRALAAGLPNLDMQLVPGELTPPFAGLSSLFDAAEMPLLNLANLGWYEQVLGSARDDGVRVVLTGEMGNGTISYDGEGLFYELLKRGRWLALSRELSASVHRRGRGWWPVVKASLLRPAAPDWLWEAYWRSVRGHGCVLPIEFPINSEFAAEWQAMRRYTRAYGCHPTLAASVDPKYRAMLLSGQNIGDGLDALHALSARFGIEVRDPTADVRVIEFCMAVPEEQYARQGRTRCLVRRAMRGRLPDAILENTRLGLQGVDWLDRLMVDRDGIAKEVERMEQSDAARRYLDVPRLRRLVDDWPEDGLEGAQARDDYGHLLPWGIMIALFLRWIDEQA